MRIGFWQLRIGASVLAGVAMMASCTGEVPQSAQPILDAAAAIAAKPPAAKPALATNPAAYPVKGFLGIERTMQAGEYAWNDEGVADGPRLIAVDLAAQRIYVYRDGYEIGRASILYGADDKPTPLGTFTVLEKKRHHVSNLYGSPMPYLLRLTWDGVALHSSLVEDGSATHGCIGLPDDFAAMIFERARIGDRVVITNSWMPEVYRGRPAAGQTI
jgi:lipoprotein-anchoring transpeptidase ErfK/SrfK